MVCFRLQTTSLFHLNSFSRWSQLSSWLEITPRYQVPYKNVHDSQPLYPFLFADLPATPWQCQVGSCLCAFILAIPSARRILPPPPPPNAIHIAPSSFLQVSTPTSPSEISLLWPPLWGTNSHPSSIPQLPYPELFSSIAIMTTWLHRTVDYLSLLIGIEASWGQGFYLFCSLCLQCP